MLIIKNIEFIETDRDPYEILSHQMSSYQAIEVMTDKGKDFIGGTELRELIRGRRFVRPSDGLDIMIGVSKQAQNVIGIQYEAWENMEESHNLAIDKATHTANKLAKLKKSNLWKRIKFVFTGIK